MTTLLLTGANGQVGWELLRTLAPLGHVIALTREQLDLSDIEAIRATVARHRPDVIVNPAAYTAVDKAETDAETAYAVNAYAPGALALAAKELDALLVHYSTDYVFDGRKTAPYSETDTPNPQSIYGKSKLEGERAVQAAGGRHLILRTSWVYGLHGGNFMKTVLRLARERDSLRIVNDQFGAPTWARLIAQTTHDILRQALQPDFDRSRLGLYHLTARGRISWYDYAQEIIRLARQYDPDLRDKTLSVQGIPTQEYPLPAARPSNSVLATNKLCAAFGVNLPDWQADLAECVRQLYDAPAG